MKIIGEILSTRLLGATENGNLRWQITYRTEKEGNAVVNTKGDADVNFGINNSENLSPNEVEIELDSYFQVIYITPTGRALPKCAPVLPKDHVTQNEDCATCRNEIEDGDEIVSVSYGNVFNGGEQEYGDTNKYHAKCVSVTEEIEES